jgi:hypothetical protein
LIVRKLLTFGLMALIFPPPMTAAQNQPLAFEVASVKPSRPGALRGPAAEAHGDATERSRKLTALGLP